TAVRYPKGGVCADIEAIDRIGSTDVLLRDGDEDVLVVGVGSMVGTAVDVARRLSDDGVGVTVVDPRWVKPIASEIVELAGRHRLVVSIEDNGRVGGVGAMVQQAVADAGVRTPVRVHGIAQEFLDHAKRDHILQRVGLSVDAVATDARHCLDDAAS
ncbi:MAG TPA: transketolase C-terminal domain-containing protein, partial [Nocardioidaceae bacterium]|nr:transketolase C-terminal domain-containing protein [Nocardioidaceae bacterium]